MEKFGLEASGPPSNNMHLHPGEIPSGTLAAMFNDLNIPGREF